MSMEDGSIDFRSDTVTKPTPLMRKAMYEAEVGDDFYRDDPTINRLQEKAAGMLGMEAALFVTSGTMANMISIFTQTHRGEEIIIESSAHVWRCEAGHLSAISGLMCQRVQGEMGVVDPVDVESAIRGREIYEPRTSLVSLETPNNGAGGIILPPENIAAIAQIAKKHGLAFHIDGARIFNATVALKIDPVSYIKGASSIMFCLSKSLCCPFGSLILGNKAFVEEARHWRIMLGGGLRQGGIMAAAGLVALACMIDRLEEDHIHARQLAVRLQEEGLAKLELERVQTNMFRADFSPICSDGNDLREFLWKRNIKMSITEKGFSRLVTHYWISSEDIDTTIAALHDYECRNKQRAAGS